METQTELTESPEAKTTRLEKELAEARAKLSRKYATESVYASSQPSPADVSPGLMWDNELKRFVPIR